MAPSVVRFLLLSAASAYLTVADAAGHPFRRGRVAAPAVPEQNLIAKRDVTVTDCATQLSSVVSEFASYTSSVEAEATNSAYISSILSESSVSLSIASESFYSFSSAVVSSFVPTSTVTEYITSSDASATAAETSIFTYFEPSSVLSSAESVITSAPSTEDVATTLAFNQSSTFISETSELPTASVSAIFANSSAEQFTVSATASFSSEPTAEPIFTTSDVPISSASGYFSNSTLASSTFSSASASETVFEPTSTGFANSTAAPEPTSSEFDPEITSILSSEVLIVSSTESSEYESSTFAPQLTSSAITNSTIAPVSTAIFPEVSSTLSSETALFTSSAPFLNSSTASYDFSTSSIAQTIPLSTAPSTETLTSSIPAVETLSKAGEATSSLTSLVSSPTATGAINSSTLSTSTGTIPSTATTAVQIPVTTLSYLLNGGFESLPFEKYWTPSLDPFRPESLAIRDSLATGIASYGARYLEIVIKDGAAAKFRQSVDVNPRSRYRISGYGQLAIRQPRNAGACTLQICDAVSRSCSRIAGLNSNGFTYVNKKFTTRARQTTIEFEVTVTCPFMRPGHENEVYLDQFRLIST